MERHDLPSPGMAAAIDPAGQLPDFADAGTIASQDSPINRLMPPLRAMTELPADGSNLQAGRISRLSLHEFCDRISLLAELELPCSVYVANGSAEQISRGVVRRIERDADRLNLFGDGFSLHLHQNNIDAVWLVHGGGHDDQGMAIEIHNRTGSLVARLFGMQDGIGAAVWQDVMGNPSFTLS